MGQMQQGGKGKRKGSKRKKRKKRRGIFGAVGYGCGIVCGGVTGVLLMRLRSVIVIGPIVSGVLLLITIVMVESSGI